jgi:hypothetical protein
MFAGQPRNGFRRKGIGFIGYIEQRGASGPSWDLFPEALTAVEIMAAHFPNICAIIPAL